MKPLRTDLSSKFSRDYANRRHRQYLHEIKEKWFCVNNSVPIGSKLMETHSKSPEFRQRFRKEELARQNAKILSKLTEASEGFRNTAVQLRFHGTDRSGPTTLNSPLRRREAQRIHEENVRLVKRLNGRDASVSNKKLFKEYIQNKTYKKQISRLQLIDVGRKPSKSNLLPKLRRTESPLLKDYSMRQLSVSPRGVLYKKKKPLMFLDDDGELLVVEKRNKRKIKSNEEVLLDLNTNNIEED